MSQDLGQCLINLACRPQEQGILPVMLAESLATGLGADFCIWEIAPEQSWFWCVTGKQGRWTGQSFGQDATRTFKSVKSVEKTTIVEGSPTQYVREKEFRLVPEDLPDLKSVMGKNCRGAAGLKTYFQGDCNGFVIVGDFYTKKNKQKDYFLFKLQESLGIVNQLLLSMDSKRDNSGENLSSSTDSDTPIILSSSSPQNLFEKSAILKIWYNASRQQLEQQKQWNEQLINNIITVMSDQTRNPLATIRMGIEILRQGNHDPEKFQQKLEIIEQEWHKLNNINGEILQLRELKQKKNTVQLQNLDVISLLKSTISLQEAISKRVSLNYLGQNCNAEANFDHLQQIFQELLTNAQKFSVPDSVIKIGLENNHHDPTLGRDMVKLTFANLTPALDSQNTKHFFDPFYREQWAVDVAIAGIGLGLTITRTLVEQLNGKIDVACEPCTPPDQSVITFTLLIPRPGATQ